MRKDITPSTNLHFPMSFSLHHTLHLHFFLPTEVSGTLLRHFSAKIKNKQKTQNPQWQSGLKLEPQGCEMRCGREESRLFCVKSIGFGIQSQWEYIST